MNTRLILAVVILIALAGGGALYLHNHKATDPFALPPDQTQAAVVKGNMTESVSSTGIVASNLDVLVKCQAGGEVIKLPYEESDHVKKGDLLLQLDPQPEDTALKLAQITVDQDVSKVAQAQQAEQQAELNLVTAREQADTNIKAAEVKARDLRLQANREKELLTQKLASDEDFETADTTAAQAETDLMTAKIAREELQSQAVAVESSKEAVKLAQAQLASDKVAVDLAQLNVSYAKVTAPMDGIVTQVQVQIGGMVSSALNNAGGGTTILTLSDMSKVFVLANVDESDIADVRPGQDVVITADAFPNQEFAGKVILISAEGVNVSNVVTFEVKVEVTSANKDILKPQMTANVTIIESHKNGVLIVPQLAIYEKKHKDYVKVLNPDGSIVEREVHLGIIEDYNQEVVSGLKEGEQVLVAKDDSGDKWAAKGFVRPPRR